MRKHHCDPIIRQTPSSEIQAVNNVEDVEVNFAMFIPHDGRCLALHFVVGNLLVN